MTTASPQAAHADHSLHDDSIEAKARRMLQANHHFRGRADLFVLRHEGDALTIEGAVRSFYLKQLIQTILNRVEGVKKINNRVQVVPAHPQGGGHHNGHLGPHFT